MTSKRIEWVDIAKAICIICVLASHTAFCTDSIKTIFVPFFLSLFFFIFGYLYKDKYLI